MTTILPEHWEAAAREQVEEAIERSYQDALYALDEAVEHARRSLAAHFSKLAVGLPPFPRRRRRAAPRFDTGMVWIEVQGRR